MMTHTLEEDPAQVRAPASPSRGRGFYVVVALGILMFLLGLAGGAYQGKLGKVQKNDSSSYLPGSAESTKVSNQIGKFSSTQTIPGFIVYERKSGLTDADKQKIAADAAAFRKAEGVASDQVGVPDIKRTVASTSVPLVAKVNGKEKTSNELNDAEKAVLDDIAKKNRPAGLTVYGAGAGGLIAAFVEVFNGIDGVLLISAILVVVVILLVVYRSPSLWVFPLASAFLALNVAALIIYPLAKHGSITLNGQSQGILSVLVIGAGTDYALLLISRYREELHNYDSPVDAIITAWKGAAPAIGASAITVMLGLSCLSFGELNSDKSLGPVCAIGVASTVAMMLTFLPMFLLFPRVWAWSNPVGWVLLAKNRARWALRPGRAVFWPRVPHVDHEADIATHGLWGRFAQAIGRHARRAWIITALALAACAVLITGLKSAGLNNNQSFTSKPDAIVGQELYDKNFDVGAGAPAQIIAAADTQQAVIDAVRKVPGVSQHADGVCVAVDYGKVTQFLKQNPAAAAQANSTRACPPAALQVTPKDNRIVIDANLVDRYDTSQAATVVRDIRDAVRTVPGANALVGGQTATNLDVRDASRHDRNLIIPIILAVILVVLAIVLRSLLAPLLLIATVILSFMATLGVSAFVFNHVFHFANSDPGFPLFAFVFLVALGIDYNIFLMTRVREEALKFGTRTGVLRGLAVTGGVITSAGFVLAATFVVLGVLPLVFFAELGFCVAFGVLLDTIVVRSILVPSLTHEIGKKIWWPSRLAAAEAKD
jgi:putative drug exporter of the RND superfamily